MMVLLISVIFWRYLLEYQESIEWFRCPHFDSAHGQVVDNFL